MYWGSCIYVLEVMYLSVGGHAFVCWDHAFMCWGSCNCVLEVMYLSVGGHAFVCWRSCI